MLVIAYNQTLQLRENVGPRKQETAAKEKRKWWKIYGEKKPMVSKVKDIFNIEEESSSMEALHNTSIPKDDDNEKDTDIMKESKQARISPH